MLPLLTAHLVSTSDGALAAYLLLHDGAATVSVLEVMCCACSSLHTNMFCHTGIPGWMAGNLRSQAVCNIAVRRPYVCHRTLLLGVHSLGRRLVVEPEHLSGARHTSGFDTWCFTHTVLSCW